MTSLQVFARVALVAAAGVFGSAAMAQDSQGASTQQKAMAKNLPQTVVVRVAQTGQAEILESSAPLKADPTTVAALSAQKFQPADVSATSKSGDELDQYQSRDSWYRSWHGGGWGGRGWGGWGGRGWGYSPFYGYGGYNYYYNPFYSYYYAPYWYYYYGW